MRKVEKTFFAIACNLRAASSGTVLEVTFGFPLQRGVPVGPQPVDHLVCPSLDACRFVGIGGPPLKLSNLSAGACRKWSGPTAAHKRSRQCASHLVIVTELVEKKLCGSGWLIGARIR
jgi:hypothetical protein